MLNIANRAEDMIIIRITILVKDPFLCRIFALTKVMISICTTSPFQRIQPCTHLCFPALLFFFFILRQCQLTGDLTILQI